MTKIAIIEDDAMISQMYRMKFEMDGFDVEISNNGFDGLKMLDDFRPNLLLLDFFLPEMNGVEIIEKIRANTHLSNLPVIILTNADKSEITENLDKFNIAAYIVKAHLTPRQVVEKVKETLTK